MTSNIYYFFALGGGFKIAELFRGRAEDRPARKTRGAAAELPADAKKHRDRLRLQDPLEVSRDLGAVLTRRTSAQLRYACLETYVHLVASVNMDADAPRPELAFPFLAAEE